MGADMLVAVFYEPMDESFKPDWNKGHKHIDKLTSKSLSDLEHLGDDNKAIKASLHEKLETIKDAYTKGCRELTHLEFPPYRIYITGGMSWGDSPTELFSDINDLEQVNVINACGYNEIIDYKVIVDKILKQKSLLPILMSLDDDLDALISKQLKGKKS